MVPKHLNHKPIVSVDNYKSLDGHYVYTGSDVEYLSIGYAQFDNTNPDELTAKVLRRHDDRWCRQSEELPLHRCVDLCNLIVQSIMKVKGINYSHVQTKIVPDFSVSNSLEDIKKFYDRLDSSKSGETFNQLREKLRELRVLIDILNP